MNTTTKSNSKEFIEIPSNSTMAKDITSYKKNKFTTRDLAETSLLIALVFIATRFINIRLPLASTGGLVHLGNTMLFIAAIVFGKRKGAIAGAFGMGLFDLLSEWAIWAPFTFVVRGVMGYIIGSIAAIPPSLPRHDMTTASEGALPSRISSQPMMRRPCCARNLPMRSVT